MTCYPDQIFFGIISSWNKDCSELKNSSISPWTFTLRRSIDFSANSSKTQTDLGHCCRNHSWCLGWNSPESRGGKFTYEVSPGAIQRETLVTVGIHWRFTVPFIEMHRFFTHRKQGFGKTQMIWLKVFPWCFSGIWVCCKRELLSWGGSPFTPMSMIMGGRVFHHSVWKTKKTPHVFLFLLVSTSLSQKKKFKIEYELKIWCSDFGIF